MEKHPIADKVNFMFDKEEAETIIRFFDLYNLSLLYQGEQFEHILNALLLIKSKGHITNDDRTEYNILLYHEVPILKMLALLHKTTEDVIRAEFKSNGITWNDILASMSIKCSSVRQVYADTIEMPKLKDPDEMDPIKPSHEPPSLDDGNVSKFVNTINRWLRKQKP